MTTTAHSSSSDFRGRVNKRKEDIMTPSKPTTDGQIDKAVANYRALLEKHSGEFNTEAVQIVLGQSELAGEQFTIFCRRVEVFSSLFFRRATVKRNRTPQEALDATFRKQYTDRKVVESMPKGEGDEVEVGFFRLDLSKCHDYISDDDLEMEFELRGLKSADPISIAAVNEADHDFADEKPHCTHWKNADGKWCFATFYHWSKERKVDVGLRVYGWDGYWWFAAVRK